MAPKSRSNLATSAGAALVAVPMLVLGVSSIAKFAEMPQFVASLKTWALVPPTLTLPIAFLIVACEFTISVWWFIGGRRICCALAGAVLLLGFAGMYTLHLAHGIRPSCACMGALQRVMEATTEGWTVAGRAFALASLIILGTYLSSLGARVQSAAARAGAP